MLELLFKYEPSVLASGTVSLQWPWSVYLAAVIVLSIAGPWLLGYTRFAAPGGKQPRALLWGLRSGLLALLLLMLLRPVLQVETEEAVRGHIAVLLDDSTSMQVADLGGVTRGEVVRSGFQPGAGGVARALEARFDTRYYRFSAGLEPLGPADELSFSGGRSELAAALDALTRGHDAGSLAAVVLVSDGGSDGELGLEAPLLALEAAGVPVHVVAVGRERFEQDIEITEVAAPGSVLEGPVFTARRGGPVHPENFRRRVWAPAVAEALGPDRLLTPHALRHTWASLHMKAGSPLHWIQQQGGWESKTMLLEVYGNPPAEKTDHADALDRLREAAERAETASVADPDGPEAAARS